MALPAFVLAGALMEAAGISRRLVDIAEALAGPVTGGLGMATVLACVFFGAISGSGRHHGGRGHADGSPGHDATRL